jgi:hypothetical protein
MFTIGLLLGRTMAVHLMQGEYESLLQAVE